MVSWWGSRRTDRRRRTLRSWAGRETIARRGPAGLAGALLDASGKLASTIAGAQILFDGIAAPLVYASATQVSGIVPYEVAGKSTTQVTARYQGSTTTALAVNV